LEDVAGSEAVSDVTKVVAVKTRDVVKNATQEANQAVNLNTI
jgi:hypothetical protein